jgi:hypothetical protein
MVDNIAAASAASAKLMVRFMFGTWRVRWPCSFCW